MVTLGEYEALRDQSAQDGATVCDSSSRPRDENPQLSMDGYPAMIYLAAYLPVALALLALMRGATMVSKEL